MTVYLIVNRFEPWEFSACNALLMKKAIEKTGRKCGIFSVQGPNTAEAVRRIEELPHVKKDDLIIYFYRNTERAWDDLASLPAKKLLVYYDPVRPLEKRGLYDIAEYLRMRSEYLSTAGLKDLFDGAMVFSHESRLDLAAMDFKCPVTVIKPMLSEKVFMQQGRDAAIDGFNEKGYVNIVCCGRMLPDDGLHKAVLAYAAYRRYYNRKSRLLVIGGNGSERYRRRLRSYADMMMAQEVSFVQVSSPEERRAYIRRADAVILPCGGFDLAASAAEAAFLGTAAAAEKCPANAAVLGEDMLIDGLEPHLTAAFIHRCVSDPLFREQAAEYCRVSVQGLEGEKAEAEFTAQFNDLLGRMAGIK